MQGEFNGLPLFKATFPEEADGILRVSLVDCPAVESDFMCFAKQSAPQMYSVANEEKRLVRGVILRADYPIYRTEPIIGEYYIVFEPKEIRELAEKYLYDGRQNHVNIMHERNSDVGGVNLRQIFIKDTANGINPKGFEEIEEGSLFGEYHVTNDAVWDEIKKGTYKGFSVEIVGSIDPDVFRKQPKKTQKNMFKKFIKRFVVKMAAVTTDKGILGWDGEEDLKVGDAVYLETDGQQEAAPDGDYTTEDGKTIKVAGGVVAEIVEPEEDIESTEAPAEEMAEEETPAEEKKPEANYDEKIAELEAKIAELEEKITKVAESSEALASQFEEFAKKPAADPAHDEFKREMPEPKSNAARIMAAKRK